MRVNLFKSVRGFTLVEAAVVLLGLLVLAATLAPNIGRLNSLARQVRVKEDLSVLCTSLKIMLDDLGAIAFFDAYGSRVETRAGYSSSSISSRTEYPVVTSDCASGSGDCGPALDCETCNMSSIDCGPACEDDCDPSCRERRHRPEFASITTQTTEWQSQPRSYSARSRVSYGSSYLGSKVGLFIGDGAIPGSAIGPTEWQLPLGSGFSEAATFSNMYDNFVVATFADQLIHRDPTLYGADGNAYGSATYGVHSSYGGSLSARRFFRWRGPYIADAIAPDPWGNRYMANAFALHVPYQGARAVYRGGAPYMEGYGSATICYTAGPNGLIETDFNQPYGWTTYGDDSTVVLAGAGGMR